MNCRFAPSVNPVGAVSARVAWVLALWLSLVAIPAMACDPCALYQASRLQGHERGALSLSVSEQYTQFDRTEQESDRQIRDGELVRGFSTTQFAVGYDISERLGVQLTVPLIVRSYDKLVAYRAQGESDVGLGDITLSGSISVYDRQRTRSQLRVALSAGVKLPTGDTDAIGSSLSAGETSAVLVRHHPAAGAGGGRALTLGSGSVDGIFGASMFTRNGRVLTLSWIQYGARTEGDYDYRFGDDLLLSVGPGYYLSLDDYHTVALRLALNGEFKAADTLREDRVSGSSISNIYVGPELLVTLSDYLAAEAGVDFRTTSDDPGSLVASEYRIRTSLSYRFGAGSRQ